MIYVLVPEKNASAQNAAANPVSKVYHIPFRQGTANLPVSAVQT